METNTEIVIIGSGLNKIYCVAMLAQYGYDVIICESHSIAGDPV